MNRKACMFATLVAFLLVLTQAGLAQNLLLTQPNPELGTLIAWSQLQNPRPLPEPRPDPAPSPGTPQEQPKSGQPDSAVAQQQPMPVQTITGTIAKEDGKFVLKASDSRTYQIDDQDKARQFEGKQVKIVGSLDASTGTIHLQSIELAS